MVRRGRSVGESTNQTTTQSSSSARSRIQARRAHRRGRGRGRGGSDSLVDSAGQPSPNDVEPSAQGGDGDKQEDDLHVGSEYEDAGEESINDEDKAIGAPETDDRHSGNGNDHKVGEEDTEETLSERSGETTSPPKFASLSARRRTGRSLSYDHEERRHLKEKIEWDEAAKKPLPAPPGARTGNQLRPKRRKKTREEMKVSASQLRSGEGQRRRLIAQVAREMLHGHTKADASAEVEAGCDTVAVSIRLVINGEAFVSHRRRGEHRVPSPSNKRADFSGVKEKTNETKNWPGSHNEADLPHPSSQAQKSSVIRGRRMLPLRGNRGPAPSSTTMATSAQAHRSIYHEASTGEEEEEDQFEGDIEQQKTTPEASAEKLDPASKLDESPPPSGGVSSSSVFLGDDGNKFHCHTCQLVGDVVCCDGCPNVYHRKCLPPNSRSRMSLERDDDPWYCPECFKKNRWLKDFKRGRKVGKKGKKGIAAKPRKGWSNKRSKKSVANTDRAVEGDEWEEDVDPVENEGDGGGGGGGGGGALRRGGAVRKKRKQSFSESQDGDEAALTSVSATHRKRKKLSQPPAIWAAAKRSVVAQPTLAPSARSWSYDGVEDDGGGSDGSVSSLGDNDRVEGDEGNVRSHLKKKPGRRGKLAAGVHSAKKMGRKQCAAAQSAALSATPSAPVNHQKSKLKVKRRKKAKERLSFPVAATGALTPAPPSPIKRPVRAHPAFFFYLRDNRRHLLKLLLKKRGKLPPDDLPPRGLERNRILAREGAKQWSKKSPEERMYFTNLAMKDFERRVRKWKDSESNIESHFTPAALRGMSTDKDSSMPHPHLTLSLTNKESRDNHSFDRELEETLYGYDGTDEIRVKKKSLKYGTGGKFGSQCPSPTTLGEAAAVPRRKLPKIIRTRPVPSVPNCKPHRQRDGGANRFLLELLQDSRFHPLPLVKTTRTKDEFRFVDYSKMTIPQFEVQGPVCTSVGDVCLGCARGWCHFCPVLKRQFPSVEHRAKLQPPMSSLMATRIGLVSDAFDTKVESVEGNQLQGQGKLQSTQSSAGQRHARAPDSLFSPFSDGLSPNVTGRSPMQRDSLNSKYLFHPNGRDDDVLQFIEGSISIKVPHRIPPLPSEVVCESDADKGLCGKNDGKSDQGRQDENKADAKKFASMIDDGTGISHSLFTCRCKAVTHSGLGCVTCRRSLFIAEMSKRFSHSAQANSNDSTSVEASIDAWDEETGLLKVETAMLGRFLRGGHGYERQKEGDRAIASVLSGQDWKPNVIMPSRWPPHTSSHPAPRSNESRHDESGRLPKTASSPTSHRPVGNVDSASVNGEGSRQCGDAGPSAVSLLNGGGGGGVKGATRTRKPRAASMDTSTKEGTKSGSAGAQRGGPSLTRRRTLRSGQTAFGTYDRPTPENRQAKAQAHQDKANELSQKCLFVVTCGIFLGLVRRDPQRLFAEPVPSSVAGYHKVVVRPMDFHTIRSKILNNEYTSLGAFVADAKLLCINALAFNPPGSIYANTAQDLLKMVEFMQRRASDWMAAIKGAHASSFARFGQKGKDDGGNGGIVDPFADLRLSWPGAVEILDEVDWFRSQVQADFVRTRENEGAYYGSLAIRRAATAAAASLAPRGEGGAFAPCVLRSAAEDEELRKVVDRRVARLSDPIRSLDEPGWRETTLLQMMKKVQSRRVERRIASKSGCARCDGACIEEEAKLAMTIEAKREGRVGKGHVMPRIDRSRLDLSTGLGSSAAVAKVQKGLLKEGSTAETYSAAARTKAVSVRGSRIHGWGLFTDQPFVKGEVVAEYVGEYVGNPVADAREKMYQAMRIQDYQFRVSADLVIDATLRGGHARYINHNCNPNCVARIIDGDPPERHLKRVIIRAQRDIEAREEITYDYQFPLEHDLDARIPCNCGSDLCRGFMNWDLPEKGLNRGTEGDEKNARGKIRDRPSGVGRGSRKEKKKSA